MRLLDWLRQNTGETNLVISVRSNACGGSENQRKHATGSTDLTGEREPIHGRHLLIQKSGVEPVASAEPFEGFNGGGRAYRNGSALISHPPKNFQINRVIVNYEDPQSSKRVFTATDWNN